jgi:beta-N-acetylhexosaminidase
VKDLQTVAFNSGYEYPLLIAIDQENGGVNAIFDKLHIRQFPSALGLVASDSLEMAQSVATATAKELSCIGVNWITGPLLDVLGNSSTQPLGVRSMGDDPQAVAQFGHQFILGYHAGGLATCGKHFPSYGNLEFLGTPSEIPIVSETREQLRLSGLVPFAHAIRGGLDSMLVGACSMPHFADTPISHACLSKSVITDLLREEMGFSGVVMSDCLEIEAIYDTIGVGQATIMGMNAGCDMLMVCSSLSSQIEAISSLRVALEHDLISEETLDASNGRIRRLRSRYTSWDKAMDPLGVAGLQSLQLKHRELSWRAYEGSISLVRDQYSLIPLSSKTAGKDLVLLTPLVDPFPTAHGSVPKSFRYLKGEDTFRELGLMIANEWPGKVRHTSYTASGIRPLHEELISEASAVILLTADCGRNTYQYAFTKYVIALCRMSMTLEMPEGKPLIVVAVSSPYDFVRDTTIGTYLCTYDFTTNAFKCLVQVLFGNLKPTGFVVGTRSRANLLPLTKKGERAHQKWLVENFDYERDLEALQQLFKKVYNVPAAESGLPSVPQDIKTLILASTDFVECRYIIVRNSSTRVLYGFCAFSIIKSIYRGSIGCMFVDPDRRRLGIGQSLHFRATKYFLDHGLKEIQYGSELPAIVPGIQSNIGSNTPHLAKWIKERYVSLKLSVISIFVIHSLTLHQ